MSQPGGRTTSHSITPALKGPPNDIPTHSPSWLPDENPPNFSPHYLAANLPACLHNHPTIYIPTYLPIHRSSYLSYIHPPTKLFAYMLTQLPICLHSHPTTYISTHPPTLLATCLVPTYYLPTNRLPKYQPINLPTYIPNCLRNHSAT